MMSNQFKPWKVRCIYFYIKTENIPLNKAVSYSYWNSNQSSWRIPTLMVRQSRKQTMVSSIFPKNKQNLLIHECILFLFWENWGDYKLLSRFTDPKKSESFRILSKSVLLEFHWLLLSWQNVLVDNFRKISRWLN